MTSVASPSIRSSSPLSAQKLREIVSMNPENGLSYICWEHLPADIRPNFASFFKGEQSKVIYYFTVLNKISRKILPKERVLMVTHNAIYINEVSTGNVTRCIAVQDIKCIHVTADLLLGIEVPSQFDLLVSVNEAQKKALTVDVLPVVFQHVTRKTLLVNKLSKTQKIKNILNLKKPKGWRNELAPVMRRIDSVKSSSPARSRAASISTYQGTQSPYTPVMSSPGGVYVSQQQQLEPDLYDLEIDGIIIQVKPRQICAIKDAQVADEIFCKKYGEEGIIRSINDSGTEYSLQLKSAGFSDVVIVTKEELGLGIKVGAVVKTAEPIRNPNNGQQYPIGTVGLVKCVSNKNRFSPQEVQQPVLPTPTTTPPVPSVKKAIEVEVSTPPISPTHTEPPSGEVLEYSEGDAVEVFDVEDWRPATVVATDEDAYLVQLDSGVQYHVNANNASEFLRKPIAAVASSPRRQQQQHQQREASCSPIKPPVIRQSIEEQLPKLDEMQIRDMPSVSVPASSLAEPTRNREASHNGRKTRQVQSSSLASSVVDVPVYMNLPDLIDGLPTFDILDSGAPRMSSSSPVHVMVQQEKAPDAVSPELRAVSCQASSPIDQRDMSTSPIQSRQSSVYNVTPRKSSPLQSLPELPPSADESSPGRVAAALKSEKQQTPLQQSLIEVNTLFGSKPSPSLPSREPSPKLVDVEGEYVYDHIPVSRSPSQRESQPSASPSARQPQQQHQHLSSQPLEQLSHHRDDDVVSAEFASRVFEECNRQIRDLQHKLEGHELDSVVANLITERDDLVRRNKELLEHRRLRSGDVSIFLQQKLLLSKETCDAFAGVTYNEVCDYSREDFLRRVGSDQAADMLFKYFNDTSTTSKSVEPSRVELLDTETFAWVLGTRHHLVEDIIRMYEDCQRATHKVTLLKKHLKKGSNPATIDRVVSTERLVVGLQHSMKEIVCNKLLPKEKWDFGLASHPRTNQIIVPQGMLSDFEQTVLKKIEPRELSINRLDTTVNEVLRAMDSTPRRIRSATPPSSRLSKPPTSRRRSSPIAAFGRTNNASTASRSSTPTSRYRSSGY